MMEREDPCPIKERIPSWLRKKKSLKELRALKVRLRKACLSTVCEEARCPNITECFSTPTATFLILGDICTRGCRFCSISKGTPCPPDEREPKAVAQAAKDLNLDHVVITSVSRDDLLDQGHLPLQKQYPGSERPSPSRQLKCLRPIFPPGHRWPRLYSIKSLMFSTIILRPFRGCIPASVRRHV